MLSQRRPNAAKAAPQINAFYELIIAIANEGRADDAMKAARRAGATGGTVLHSMGTAPAETAHFLNVSIANEKEVILIVAKKEQKNAIMQTILESAGPQTPAGCIVFSLRSPRLQALVCSQAESRRRRNRLYKRMLCPVASRAARQTLHNFRKN